MYNVLDELNKIVMEDDRDRAFSGYAMGKHFTPSAPINSREEQNKSSIDEFLKSNNINMKEEDAVSLSDIISKEIIDWNRERNIEENVLKQFVELAINKNIIKVK